MSSVNAGIRRLPPRRMPNQVILSGPESQVNQLITDAQAWPRDPITLAPQELARYQVGRTYYKVVLVEYATPPASDQTETLNQRLLEQARLDSLTDVRTEPNCTVAAPRGSKGDPYSWQGDPYIWEFNAYAWDGDPYLWEGSPYNKPVPQQTLSPSIVAAGSDPASGAHLFASQDAFWRIQVAQHGKRNPLLKAYTGEATIVGLFDTCPSPDEFAKLPSGAAPTWLETHLSNDKLETGGMVDHGLFNASLINFIAPDAEIHLYQVLDGNGFGQTAWLIMALQQFLDRVGDQPSVVNLSMGSMCCGNGSMPAVEGILWELVRRGGVICAAAGNRGRKARKPAAIPPAQMPAALPYVISVAASNRQTIRASYSQAGDIAAPGGDTMGDGADGFDDIIGMGTSSDTGYVRMDCGTSFATPLVTGAAALALADLIKRGAPHDSGLWRRVMERLAVSAIQPRGAEGTLNTTGLGAGIIQVSGHRLVPNG